MQFVYRNTVTASGIVFVAGLLVMLFNAHIGALILFIAAVELVMSTIVYGLSVGSLRLPVSRGGVVAGVLGAVGAALLLPGQAALASVAIAIDTDPLFQSINDNLPTFFSILAIGGGITIAIAIVRLVINSITDAF
ncbi:MAG: hypothetical protein SF162_01205 [bacterium]|nr:hypothetical protein [bacterium]